MLNGYAFLLYRAIVYHYDITDMLRNSYCEYFRVHYAFQYLI